MKRLLYLFLVGVIFTFTACGGGDAAAHGEEGHECTTECAEYTAKGCAADCQKDCCAAAACCCGDEACDGSCHDEVAHSHGDDEHSHVGGGEDHSHDEVNHSHGDDEHSHEGGGEDHSH